MAAAKTGGMSTDPHTVLWKMGKPKKPGSLQRLLCFPAAAGFAVSWQDAVGESAGGRVPPRTSVRAAQAFTLSVSVHRLHTLYHKHPPAFSQGKAAPSSWGLGSPKPRVVTGADSSGAKGCWDTALKSAASRSPPWPSKSCCCFTEHLCPSVLCSAGSCSLGPDMKLPRSRWIWVMER